MSTAKTDILVYADWLEMKEPKLIGIPKIRARVNGPGIQPLTLRKDEQVRSLKATTAHLLIKRLCFSCGNGSSALRERIYFSSDEGTRMNGILIYTSSGDSEGSMGFLVRQGKEQFLAKNIIDALLDAEWCSADPVCSDIGRTTGQGPDSVNGAAMRLL